MVYAFASRRKWMMGVLAGLVLIGNSAAQSSDWPSKPIKVIVPWPPGGPTDVATRIITQRLAERLKQPFVIENRAGAAGTIGTQQAARSAPDGYTFTMMATPTLLATYLYKSKPVDVTKDLAPVAAAYDLPIVLVVNPQALPGVKTLPDLVAKIKASKDDFIYTTSSPGSIAHVSMSDWADQADLRMQHIAYKGGPAAMTDLLGGQVPVMFSDLVVALPHIQSGKLIALAIGSPRRIEQLPQVKTFAEQGFKDFSAVALGGLLAPLGTPQHIVDRVSGEMKSILDEPEVRQRLIQAGTQPAYKNSMEMTQFLRGYADKWGSVIQRKKISAD
ncbi:tripartite tricarboxylate transporter substrate binding protein [Paucibacter sp. O1-1]|nr:tripartite tricarboxylate transporter substrate binding protein [Paucibacter sp. O1-1]MDA3825077.1 tripartite tricarboxylate transporter substrate binding protein [Paucibacter sp. O1-1]